MADFAATGYGRRLFDGHIPRIVDALESIAASLKKPDVEVRVMGVDPDPKELPEGWEDPRVTAYWLRHYVNAKTGLCGLCGNTGVVNTVGAISPTGRETGIRTFCICPNGQSRRAAE